MTKIDIFSGFLGAGKTTLIKKLLKEAISGEQVVIIENEFGEIGIDGGFLKEAGIQITEMNSGCICCSLVGDFGKALKEVIETYNPDRIIIEPSGVGKLSDVIKAVKDLELENIVLNSFTTVADATKIKVYMKNFGEFYNNQVEFANCIVLSRTDGMKEEKLNSLIPLLREHNSSATIVTTPWDKLDGKAILDTMEHTDSLENDLKELHNQHHHHDHDENCDCGCHDHDHHHHHEHHHHDEHGEDCDCGCHDHDHHHHHEYHHHDEHGEDCDCGCHHHDHHHHANDIFTSWGKETARKYSVDEIKSILQSFDENSSIGTVLRAKGIVDSKDSEWIHFDYVPGEVNVRTGAAGTTGRLCVIGSNLNQEKLVSLFNI